MKKTSRSLTDFVCTHTCRISTGGARAATKLDMCISDSHRHHTAQSRTEASSWEAERTQPESWVFHRNPVCREQQLRISREQNYTQLLLLLQLLLPAHQALNGKPVFTSKTLMIEYVTRISADQLLLVQIRSQARNHRNDRQQLRAPIAKACLSKGH